MRDIGDLLTCYEQGIYTFAEVTTALICEAQVRHPSELADQLPAPYLAGISQSVSSLPPTATADDVFIIKSSREHAQAWFDGAVRWREYFAERDQGAAR